MHKQQQRGQVLPIWILGILGTFALIFTALNYGNSLRWHIRAQSAADAAAQAALAIQSERWNEMTELLYGLNVEEYRIRTLLHGILLASTYSGGCYQSSSNALAGSSTKDCDAVYQILVPKYMQAVQRYSQEASYLNQVAVNANFTTWQKDATKLVGDMGKTGTCNLPTTNTMAVVVAGGDCAFKYTFVVSNLRSQATSGYGLSTVKEDGGTTTIPSYGTAASVDTENQQLFAPVQVDIVTCSVVPPIIPSFFKMNTQPYMAIGRAAATNVMFVEDWFQPGQLVNPARSSMGKSIVFQPVESYGTPAAPSGQNHDYYSVDFGGNAAVDHSDSGGYVSVLSHDEFSVRLGWWNSIPVRPSTNIQPNVYTSNCGTGGSIS